MDTPGVWDGERNADLIRLKFDDLYSKHFQKQQTVVSLPTPSHTPVLPCLVSNPCELPDQSQPALDPSQLVLFTRPGEDPESQAAGLAEPGCDPSRHEIGVKAAPESLLLGGPVLQSKVVDSAVLQLKIIDGKQTEGLFSENLVRKGLVKTGLVTEDGGGLRLRRRSSRRECKCCVGDLNGQVKGMPANGAKKKSGPHRMGGKVLLETGSAGQWGHDVPGLELQVLVWPTRAGRLRKAEQRTIVRSRKAEKVNWMVGRRAPRRESGLGDRVKLAGVGTKLGLANQVKQTGLAEGPMRAQNGVSVFLKRNLRFGHRSQEGTVQTGEFSEAANVVKGLTEVIVSGKRARGPPTAAIPLTDGGVDPCSPEVRQSKRMRNAAGNALGTNASMSDNDSGDNPLVTAPSLPALPIPPTAASVSTRQTRLKHQRKASLQTKQPDKAVERLQKPSSENMSAAIVPMAPKRRGRPPKKRRGRPPRQGGGEPLVSAPPAEGAGKGAIVKRTEKEMESAGAAGQPICRICCAEYDERRCYLACDACDRWYHADAFKVTPEQAVVLTLFKCPRCRHTTTPPHCPFQNPSDALAKPLHVQPKLQQTYVIVYANGSGPGSAAQIERRQSRLGGGRSGHTEGLKPAGDNGRSATAMKRALQELAGSGEWGRNDGETQPLRAKKVPIEALGKVDAAERPSTVGGATTNGSRGQAGAAPRSRGRPAQLVSPGGQKRGAKRGGDTVISPVKKRPPLRLVGVTCPAVLRPKILAEGGPENGPEEGLGATGLVPLPAVSSGGAGPEFSAAETQRGGVDVSPEVGLSRPLSAMSGGSGFGVEAQELLNGSVGDALSRRIGETGGRMAKPDDDVLRPLGDAPVCASSLAASKAHRPIGETSDWTVQPDENVLRPLGDVPAGATLGLDEKAELSKRSEPATPTPPRKRIQPTKLDPVPHPANAKPPGLTAGTDTTASRPEGPVARALPESSQAPERNSSGVESLRGPVEPGFVSQSSVYRADSRGPAIQSFGRYSWEAGYYQAAARASGGGPVLPDRIHTGGVPRQSSRWSIDLSKVPEVDGRKVRMAAGKIDGIERLA